MHDFDSVNSTPYSPEDYGLPVWKDEDHLPPQPAAEKVEEKETSMTIEQAKYKLLSYAMDQLGYRESGDNWNKYAAMPEMTQLLGWDAQNQPWCNIFVNACFIACFGLETGAAMLYQPIGGGSALCRASADFFKAAGAWIDRGRTPDPGDVIFFYRTGEINHMGIVSRVAGGSVITIEGNSGDSVAERCYSVGDGGIAGYGRPNWAAAEGKDINVPINSPTVKDAAEKVEQRFYELRFPYLRRGSVGEAVTAAQIALMGRGYGIGPDGADGDFGGNTESAVRRYQAAIGLTADGIVGPDTGAALFGAEVNEPPITTLNIQVEPKADSFWNSLIAKIRKS